MGRPWCPLCVSSLILPPRRLGISGMRSNALVFVLGPKMRIPRRRATSAISCSIAAPSGPTSLNPAVKMSTYGMPLSPHCSSAPATYCGPTLMTASPT